MLSRLTLAILLMTGAAWAPAALSDTRQADCEVRKDGNKWKGASGTCSYSQRRGYVTIRLRTGESFDLRPVSQANHFRDQRGNKVVRSILSDGHQYRWEGGKKITVRWSGNSARPPHGSGQPSGPYGTTPRDLRDLIGMRSSQATNEMWRRGYELRGDGDSAYGAWRERGTGRCVMTRRSNGRLVSAVYTPEADCRR